MMGIKERLQQPVSIAPLVYLRIAFSLLLLFSTFRFIAKGWPQSLLIAPEFTFQYFGFQWIEIPRTALTVWSVIATQIIGLLGILLGFKYRLSVLLFLVGFVGMELMDASLYLNHYYFVSWMGILLLFLPTHRAFSLDHPLPCAAQKVHYTYILAPQILLGLVYCYAGIAKLHPDWVLHALPLRIWLPGLSHLPLIGPLLQYPETAFVFSWFGLIFDLTLPFWFLWKKARPWAYLTLCLFHLSTAWFFNIGVFPWVMMALTPLFFSPSWHERLLALIPFNTKQKGRRTYRPSRPILWIFATFLLFHLIFPFRFVLYPGSLFWTEQGYRYSWRVMLMEKMGFGSFWVESKETGKRWNVSPSDYLLPHQEHQLYTQPDFILQMAHHIGQQFGGTEHVAVYADISVTLNGRISRKFIDPSVDLLSQKDGWKHKNWILHE